ncbi:hypothetical protein PMAYCL1PPCAC_14366 [Pristionchus mayeri]|uniref:C6 domain-containing protein n=1 Tax=Pristionchus mayeri TaxID=1317129 RepID=A0AAN4ZS70_9BILA|nr:hypothetical protein PMAYCL1PPCAC_14366 [Pristionchus mayeri]
MYFALALLLPLASWACVPMKTPSPGMPVMPSTPAPPMCPALGRCVDSEIAGATPANIVGTISASCAPKLFAYYVDPLPSILGPTFALRCENGEWIVTNNGVAAGTLVDFSGETTVKVCCVT